jgi:GTPase KRas protein
MNPTQKYSISTRISAYGQQNEYKIVVLGVAGVGKSSVTLRFVNNLFSTEYNPTLQDTFRKQYILDDIPGTLG